MRDGDVLRGSCCFNYKDSRRGVGGNRDAISHILFCHFSCFVFFLGFFTYSEALPALRLRRDDIFGPPVGSALNNP